MKNLLNCALALALMTGIAGCGGEDDPTNPPVNTNPTLEFKQGDKYRYAYYDRDSTTNTRVDSTKRIKDWTVIRTGLTVGGRTSVSEIMEVTYDGAGTTEMGRDTFYFQATASGNGEILQYNVLGAVMRRFLAVFNYSDSIPARWVKITDTKITDPISWNSLIAGSLTTTISIDMGSIQMEPTVTISMNAAHKGAQATTVAAGPYPSAVHTDHTIIVSGMITSPVQQEIARDTLRMSYDVDSKTGLLRQVLHSGRFTPKGIAASIGAQKIPGFELELVSVTRVP